MRVVIATVQVLGVRGGAEVLAEGLRDALLAEGHAAELVAIPFKGYPAERVLDQMLACRLLDITEAGDGPVDRVIALKFPAYYVQHPNKVLWLLHQHRTAYDLWGHPYGDLSQVPGGAQVRDSIIQADHRLLPEARAIYTIAANVSRRLKKYCNMDSTPLYHPPPGAEQLYAAEAEDYLFFPSRLNPLKRQWLVVEALAHTRQPVRVRFAGKAAPPAYEHELKALAEARGVAERVEWLGGIRDEDKRHHYGHCLGVVYPPLDEDYGYVTLEAMLAARPVVTCADSGGPLEFVCDRRTGLVAEPTPEALAGALDELWQDRGLARALGAAGKEHYHGLDISWPRVVQRLLQCA
jgi:glycosyltransferase involved in cell wall biosynthesis